MSLRYSTIVLVPSFWLYINLHELYFTLLDSKLLFHSSTYLSFTLHQSTIVLLHSILTLHYSIIALCHACMHALHLILHYSTIALLHSILLNITPPRFISLYLILHHSTIALLPSTYLYINLPELHFTLLDSTLLHHSSTSLYISLH